MLGRAFVPALAGRAQSNPNLGLPGRGHAAGRIHPSPTQAVQDDQVTSSSGRSEPSRNSSVQPRRTQRRLPVVVTPDGAPNTKTKRGRRKAAQASAAANRPPGSGAFEAMVRATSSMEQVVELITQRQGSPLKPAEVVLMCNQLGRLCDPEKMTVKMWTAAQEVMSQLLRGLDPHLSKLLAYEQVVLLAALAKVRYSPSPEWLNRYFDVSLATASQFGPRYIAVLLRALTRLDVELWQLKEVPNFRAWMDAVLGVAQAKVWAYRVDELVRTLVALSELRWRPRTEFVAAFNTAIRTRLDYLDPPLLSHLMLAYATLRIEPEPQLMRAMYAQLTTKLPMLDDEDLATTAQALTLIKRVARHDFITDFLAEVLQKLPTFNAAVLTHLLSAMASMVDRKSMMPSGPACVAHSPPRSALAQLQAITTNGTPAMPSAAASIPVVAAGTVAAGSEVGDADGEMLDEEEEEEVVAAASGGRLGSGLARPARPMSAIKAERTGREVARLTAALSTTASTSSSARSSNGLSQSAGAPARALSSMDGGDGVRRAAAPGAPAGAIAGPPALWLSCVVERVHELLPTYTPTQLASTMWALSLLGCTASQEMMDEVIATSTHKLTRMTAVDLVHFATALANFGYRPTVTSVAAWDEWFAVFVRMAARREYDARQVCDLVYALSGLPSPPPTDLMHRVLRYTRLNKPSALRHTSPKRMAALAVGLRNLGHTPDFGFMHSFAQGARFHWSAFEPREYAAVLTAVASFSADALAIDELWLAEFLLMVQCKLDRFDPSSLAAVMRAAAALPASRVASTSVATTLPSQRWMEAALSRAGEMQHALNAQHAIHILWAVAHVAQEMRVRGEVPMTVPPTLMSALVTRVSDAAGMLTAQQAMEVAGSLHMLNHPPLHALDGVLAQTQQRLQQQVPHATNGHPLPAPARSTPQVEPAASQGSPRPSAAHANGKAAGNGSHANGVAVHANGAANGHHRKAAGMGSATGANTSNGNLHHSVTPALDVVQGAALVISGLQGELSTSGATLAAEQMQVVA